MQINFKKSALKELQKIPAQLQVKILNEIKKLKFYPEVKNVKKLKNHYPPLRLRVGDYRVLFNVENGVIKIYAILHRKDSYK
ncbi:MAG: type II toxin-antitoxin system RelE/ParE family toxin [Epsilonproteobacteria bacterium]|nr:type II toxin-antitoxin system RelE/ParE family toxin [Campylobacterota bacterium]